MVRRMLSTSGHGGRAGNSGAHSARRGPRGGRPAREDPRPPPREGRAGKEKGHAPCRVHALFVAPLPARNDQPWAAIVVIASTTWAVSTAGDGKISVTRAWRFR